MGKCKTIPGDPVSPRAACGGTGKCKAQCDGTNATACTYPDSGTVCTAASCTAGKLTTPSVCNSAGSCTAATTNTCTNQCASDGSAKCADPCTDTSCGTGLYCNSGACTPTLADGRTCNGDNQCANGHCVSGVCCASTCNAACFTCATGTCLPTTVGAGCSRTDGPCDVYAAGGTACVAAYSTVRGLLKAYTGPLYQVRNGSSSTNTGTGGTTKDIGMTVDGYADTATQDVFCSGTVCTVSILYDQSGNGNHLTVAKKGPSNNGNASLDDYESSATSGAVTAGGKKVYPLYMAAREGYRLAALGRNMPIGSASQGIYELVNGTRVGGACCWEFGNVGIDPTQYTSISTLFFGVGFWGKGAGAGPWFMADFQGGVWAGGTSPGDPGYGSFNGSTTNPVNTLNPSLKVPFALGVLKTTASNYALRMANLQTASDLTTAFDGHLPVTLNNQGGIVLGVGGDNSNSSYGTFYEGAITAGNPSNATDLAVLQNVKAVGYSN